MSKRKLRLLKNPGVQEILLDALVSMGHDPTPAQYIVTNEVIPKLVALYKVQAATEKKKTPAKSKQIDLETAIQEAKKEQENGTLHNNK